MTNTTARNNPIPPPIKAYLISGRRTTSRCQRPKPTTKQCINAPVTEQSISLEKASSCSNLLTRWLTQAWACERRGSKRDAWFLNLFTVQKMQVCVMVSRSFLQIRLHHRCLQHESCISGIHWEQEVTAGQSEPSVLWCFYCQLMTQSQCRQTGRFQQRHWVNDRDKRKIRDIGHFSIWCLRSEINPRLYYFFVCYTFIYRWNMSSWALQIIAFCFIHAEQKYKHSTFVFATHFSDFLFKTGTKMCSSLSDHQGANL